MNLICTHGYVTSRNQGTFSWKEERLETCSLEAAVHIKWWHRETNDNIRVFWGINTPNNLQKRRLWLFSYHVGVVSIENVWTSSWIGASETTLSAMPHWLGRWITNFEWKNSFFNWVHFLHTELMNASHSTNLFTNSCNHISTNGKALLHSHINHNNPQFLHLLWRRANARNVSFLNLSRW